MKSDNRNPRQVACTMYHVSKMLQVSCNKLTSSNCYMQHDNFLKDDTCTMLNEATEGSI